MHTYNTAIIILAIWKSVSVVFPKAHMGGCHFRQKQAEMAFVRSILGKILNFENCIEAYNW